MSNRINMDAHLEFIWGKKYDLSQMMLHFEKRKDEYPKEELKLLKENTRTSLSLIEAVIRNYEIYYHQTYKKCAWSQTTECLCGKEKIIAKLAKLNDET